MTTRPTTGSSSSACKSGINSNSIPSPRRLYGRDVESLRLVELVRQICCENAAAHLCLVHGPSGSGKTSLCQQLHRQLIEQDDSGILFLQGKFDQFQDYSSPYSALVQAFERLGQHLNQTDDSQTMSRLRAFLEHEGGILVHLIPGFARLAAPGSKKSHQEKNDDVLESSSIGTSTSNGTISEGRADPKERSPTHHLTTTSSTTERRLELASERLAVGFRSFLRIVCTPQTPLILFVDDLQWCDASSLEILSTLVDAGSGISNFMLLGGYRDEERGAIREFLDAQAKDRVTDLAIGNLQVSFVQQMVADLLSPGSSAFSSNQKSEDQAGTVMTDNNADHLQELGRLVHQKTMGNPYFVLQFLGILKREHLISYYEASHQWKFDIATIQSKMRLNSSNNNSNSTIFANNGADVAYFVTQRILTLSPDVRRILKLAACLGFSVRWSLLETLDRMELQSLQDTIVGHGLSGQRLEDATAIVDHQALFERAFDQAASEHLVHCTGEARFSFVHDRVQQCVYELIPEERIRDQLHWRTGKHLQQLYHNEQDPELLFLAADQCNRGSACMEHSELERKSLIQLNLQASHAARNKAGASLVASFLDKAVALTREEDWKNSSMYATVLEVYSLSAEVESARGKYNRSQARVDVILRKAKSPQDIIRAISVRAQTHGAQQEYAAALVEMKKALGLLGVTVPPAGKLHLRMEICKLKRMLKGATEQEFLELKPLIDKRMLLAMKILHMGVVWGWNADIYFGSLCYIVMVRISMEYGRCYLTPFAFAGFGNILASLVGDDAKAYWYGQLARHFDEGKEAFPATTMVVHCYLSHLRKPASESLETLLSAYRVSLETGDLYMGTICICVYHWVYKFCGLPLGNFVRDLRNYLTELKLCQQDYLLAFLLPDLHFGLNLTGENHDASTIAWDAIEQAESFTYKTVLTDQHLKHPAELNRCYTQLFNAILLDDVDLIKQTMSCIRARKKPFRRFDGSHVANQFFTFWDGLASFALLRREGSRQYSGIANEAIKVLTQMSKGGSVNCVGMLQLLKAEKASLNLSLTQEVDKFLYDDAISQLFRSGFVHYSAIANERAGKFMLRRRDEYWAEKYLTRALDLYKKWGAVVKIRQLQEKYPFVTPTDDEFKGVEVAIYGRSRYSAMLDSLKHVSGDHLEKLDSGSVTTT